VYFCLVGIGITDQVMSSNISPGKTLGVFEADFSPVQQIMLGMVNLRV